MKKCNACGSEFEDDVKFCPNCGSELEEKAEQEVKQEVKQEVEKVEEIVVEEKKKSTFKKGKSVTTIVFFVLNLSMLLLLYTPGAMIGVTGAVIFSTVILIMGIDALVSAIKNKKIGFIVVLSLADISGLIGVMWFILFILDSL